MSKRNFHRGPGPLPGDWLYCPKLPTSVIAGIFLPFKTPLDSKFDEQLQAPSRFHPQMVFQHAKATKKNIGLWIDLTNAKRYYNPREIENHHCKYIKITCLGHGKPPDEEAIQAFTRECSSFVQKHPGELIGVHCTHGFNRTGFMIVSYLVSCLDWSLDAALIAFAESRNPGTYRSEYVEELYQRYVDIDGSSPLCPQRPEWVTELDDIGGGAGVKERAERSSNGEPYDKKRKAPPNQPAKAEKRAIPVVNMPTRYYSFIETPHMSSPTVVAWFESLGKFFLAPKNVLSTYNTEFEHLNEFYKSLPSNGLAVAHPRVGLPCIVRFESDDNYHRGQIESILPDGRTAVILFVDYGNEQVTKLSEIKRMVPRFMNFPRLTWPCKLVDLDGIHPGTNIAFMPDDKVIASFIFFDKGTYSVKVVHSIHGDMAAHVIKEEGLRDAARQSFLDQPPENLAIDLASEESDTKMMVIVNNPPPQNSETRNVNKDMSSPEKIAGDSDGKLSQEPLNPPESPTSCNRSISSLLPHQMSFNPVRDGRSGKLCRDGTDCTNTKCKHNHY